jgi:flagella basal body P-ring formation protein FlgA
MPSNIRHLLVLAAGLAASPASAQSFQSIAAIEEQVVATLGVPVTVRCQQIGWRLRVPVLAEKTAVEVAPAANSAPVTRVARAEPIVRRGDPVSLVVTTGSFTVSRQAVAEQDGAPGDRIRVRTEPRKPPIVGQVLPDGRVAMNAFN